MDINYESLKRQPTRYDNRRVGQLIVLIRKSTQREKHSTELFLMMNKVVVKNIDNFFFMFRSHKNKHLFSPDELISESFIAFNQCVERFGCLKDQYKKPLRDKDNNVLFDWNKICSGQLNFYFFYNMSLVRKYQRLLDINYKKHNNTMIIESFSQEFVEDNYLPRFNTNIQNKFDLNEYVMGLLGLDSMESKIYLSICRDVKKNEFIKVNKMKSMEYDEYIESIKLKLIEDAQI